MPKYLIQASYTTEGVQGLLSDGGSARTEAAAAAATSLGGSVEAFYFAFGSEDAFVVADLASNADAAALSLAVSASGAVNARVTVLLTPEELDAAAETVRNSVSSQPAWKLTLGEALRPTGCRRPHSGRRRRRRH